MNMNEEREVFFSIWIVVIGITAILITGILKLFPG